MFLKPNKRFKDGKAHIYYTLNESVRINKRRTVQRTILHLGELTTSQHHRWRHTVDVINERQESRQMELLTEDEHQRRGDGEDPDVVVLRLSSLEVRNCREFGSCWIGVKLWQMLDLDLFWSQRLGALRGEVPWEKVAELLAVNRLCDPGSELSVHEKWYPRTGMNLLLDCDDSVAEKDRLYRCLDRLVKHKDGLEKHLKRKWGELFAAQFDVLLYDLTSTYFEGLMEEVPQAKRGYSRDHRPDCKQLVIALIVTPEGLPLSYEIFDGNTRDVRSLETMMNQVEAKYGKANRTWVFDRGVVSEENLQKVRERGGTYVVGTPRSRLKDFETELLEQDWQEVRGRVDVKLRAGQDGDLYVIARSVKRRAKENAMRRNRIRSLYDSLKRLAASVEHGHVRQYDVLIHRLGRLQERYVQVFGFVEISHQRDHETIQTFEFRLKREALKKAYRQDGIYLLRTNLREEDPAKLWEQYTQLTEVEAAFRTLKSEVGLRPIFHWVGPRVEAHVMLAFIAYAMWVCLKWKLKAVAASLSPRQVIELFRSIQLVEVWFDTVDNRRICLPRITMPEPHHQAVLDQIKWCLPKQPPPRIYTRQKGRPENVLETHE
jgi:transposase